MVMLDTAEGMTADRREVFMEGSYASGGGGGGGVVVGGGSVV